MKISKIIFNSFSLSVLIATSTLLVSCKKDNSDVKQAEENNVVQYLDGVQVNAADPQLQKEGLYNVREIKENESGLAVTTLNAFTTIDKYYEFGKDHGYDFEKQLTVIDSLKSYAKSSGAMAEYESTGIIPQYYVEHENKIAESKTKESYRLAVGVKMWDGPNKGGDNFFYGGHSYAVMPFLNNSVSSFAFVNGGGVLHLFDKAFYINHLETVISTDESIRNLGVKSNNKVSSFMQF